MKAATYAIPNMAGDKPVYEATKLEGVICRYIFNPFIDILLESKHYSNYTHLHSSFRKQHPFHCIEYHPTTTSQRHMPPYAVVNTTLVVSTANHMLTPSKRGADGETCGETYSVRTGSGTGSRAALMCI